MQDDVKILDTLFLDAVFPIIYTLARSFTPFPCLECNLNFPVHPSHSCQLPEEDVRFKAVNLASVQVQQHILELLTNINDILKRDGMDRFKNITLSKFLTYFLGEEANSPTIVTQLPLNTDWIELLSARMVAHECNRGGLDLVLSEEMTCDYWASDELSSGEDNDSSKSMFGDL